MSVCPIFGDIKSNHLVKVAFTTDFLVGEDVTLERRKEMKRIGRKSVDIKKKRLRKESCGSSFFQDCVKRLGACFLLLTQAEEAWI